MNNKIKVKSSSGNLSNSKKSRVSNSIEDMDYFLYNSEEDAREVKEMLGLDRGLVRSYDSSYLNDSY